MNKSDHPDMLRVDSIEAWSRWLRDHGEEKKVAWLVFRKKSQGKVPFDYQMALDEALCYGWVDSLLKSIDEKEYMRKFTPRKPSSTWSEINKKRVQWLIARGRMTPRGQQCIDVAKKNGMWDKGVQPPPVDDSLPGALLNAFQASPEARDHYFALPEGKQRQYNIWINMAKRAETVQKRLSESILKLERGEELGLK
jgi:uncharacterized protein YdeI (YjbR/CyaY-like superfamily)